MRRMIWWGDYYRIPRYLYSKEDFMNKLQIFWKSRKTWIYAFYEWYNLMFPHIIKNEWGPLYDEIDEQDNTYWFFESLNNYGNIFDEWGL